ARGSGGGGAAPGTRGDGSRRRAAAARRAGGSWCKPPGLGEASRAVSARRRRRAAMQHILHVRVVSGAGGGPDKTIVRSAAYVDPRRDRVTCAYLHPAGDPGIDVIRATAARYGTELIAIPERGPIDFAAIRALTQLCQRRSVTVWHGHDYKSDLLGLSIRSLHPMTLVTTAHGFTRET